jgi:hypothetical protein
MKYKIQSSPSTMRDSTTYIWAQACSPIFDDPMDDFNDEFTYNAQIGILTVCSDGRITLYRKMFGQRGELAKLLGIRSCRAVGEYRIRGTNAEAWAQDAVIKLQKWFDEHPDIEL